MPVSPTAIQHAMSTAVNALRSGDLSGAEAAIRPFLSDTQPLNPDLLNVAGTLRMHQARFGEAAIFLVGQWTRPPMNRYSRSTWD